MKLFVQTRTNKSEQSEFKIAVAVTVTTNGLVILHNDGQEDEELDSFTHGPIFICGD